MHIFNNINCTKLNNQEYLYQGDKVISGRNTMRY